MGPLCATALCLMMTAVSSSSITPSIRFLHTYPESSCKFLTHPTHSGQEGFSLTFYLLPCGLLIPLPFTLHFALYAAGCTISDFFNMTPKYFLKVLKGTSTPYFLSATFWSPHSLALHDHLGSQAPSLKANI